MATTLLYRLPSAQIDTLVLDASESEHHSATVEVTEHPVELGADVTDHARVKPEEVTIQGLVSNTPVSRNQATRVVDASGVAFLTTAADDALDGAIGYAEDAYAKLRALKDARQTMTVLTTLRTYTNMLLTSVEVPRDSKTGDALRFTAKFKEIRFAAVQITSQRIQKTPKSNKKKDLGAQVGKPAKQQETTVAYDLFGGLVDNQHKLVPATGH